MVKAGILTGTVKYYDWGGTEFIPQLIEEENVNNRPYAEYWLGVHPQADCRIIFDDKQEIPLREFIHNNPEATVGQEVVNRFGTIPYLLKVLDVNKMLSIQVHPSRAAAKQSFNEENDRGIPLDAPTRNYKDENHKPELMVALGDFWLLHGFRPKEEMRNILTEVPELNFLLPVFEKTGYSGLYQYVMELAQEEVNQRLKPLIERISRAKTDDKSNPDYWAVKAQQEFSRPGTIDRGIFSVYLFNLLHLKDGEGIFQDAGLPHAYLYGRNVEIMASSDNVLRGGLTTKHIDVPELLKHVRCEETIPVIIKREKAVTEKIYATSAPDFELSSYDINAGETVEFVPGTAEIILLIAGEADIKVEATRVSIKKGQPSAIVFPGQTVSIESRFGALIFRARVPVDMWNK